MSSAVGAVARIDAVGSVDGSRQRRRWRRTVLAAAVGVLAAACAARGPSDAGTPARGVAAAHSQGHAHGRTGGEADDGVLDVTARDHRFRSEHATVGAGTTRVRLTNRGKDVHQLQIGKLRTSMSPEEFVELFADEGDRASVDALSWVGGVGVVAPGRSGTAEVKLTPGDYLMVCYVTGPDGRSHVMEGMVAPLHVEAAEAPEAAPRGEPAETVVLGDYRIEVPAGFRGDGEVAFRNEGGEPHEVILLRLEDGRTLADAVAYEADPTLPRPFTFAGGVASIEGGATAVATLDLEPGDYIATCFVPAPDGTPHVDLGMIATFTVT